MYSTRKLKMKIMKFIGIVLSAFMTMDIACGMDINQDKAFKNFIVKQIKKMVIENPSLASQKQIDFMDKERSVTITSNAGLTIKDLVNQFEGCIIFPGSSRANTTSSTHKRTTQQSSTVNGVLTSSFASDENSSGRTASLTLNYIILNHQMINLGTITYAQTAEN